jgi:hypothetical protein
MPEQTVVDRVKSLAGGYVDGCLDDLERAGEAPRAFTAVGRGAPTPGRKSLGR